jgi:hypothetical protein
MQQGTVFSCLVFWGGVNFDVCVKMTELRAGRSGNGIPVGGEI